MSVALDTSVVLRLLTGEPPAQTEAALTFLGLQSSPAVLSDLVIAESYHALKHHYSVSHSDAVKFLTMLAHDPKTRCSGVAQGVLKNLNESRSANLAGLLDLLIHADYQREDAQLITFDRDLGRLPGVLLLKD